MIFCQHAFLTQAFLNTCTSLCLFWLMFLHIHNLFLSCIKVKANPFSFWIMRCFKQVNTHFFLLGRTFIFPSTIYIISRAVFMKVRPNIRGVSSSSSMSSNTKSIGNKKVSTLTKTSSAMPDGYVIDFPTNCNDILVSFISKSHILLITDNGIRLILDPRSMSVFPISTLPMVTCIMTWPISFSFSGRFL